MTNRGEGRLKRLLASRNFRAALLFCLCLLTFEILLFPDDYARTILVKHFHNGSYLRLFAVLLLSCGPFVLSIGFVCVASVAYAVSFAG